MFDVTPDDLLALSDGDLRELVGRLCEAELIGLGRSPVAVTYGGNQDASDGGIDVRVDMPPGDEIAGFIPRTSTGFQVKKPDMPPAAILDEMKPGGSLRASIAALAAGSGAYIVVSSSGSVADSALERRRTAIREALRGEPNADHLHTDFYDRTRLATWVRTHPGLIAWVLTKTGRRPSGWQAYGSWANHAEAAGTEFLLDEKLRLHLGDRADSDGQTVEQAIDKLRDKLRNPGQVVRLVGLSGVGKTRLAQALFDQRIGARPLPSSRAIYSDLSDNPSPQPSSLVSDLIQAQAQAILIVDNCPPDLHRRLSELCRAERTTVSVLTIEYDIREDQPEGTDVFTLDTSSPELIDRLVETRYPSITQVDRRTIAEASGGNSRIAIALADTVGRSDSIAGLSSEDLFERLFRQRHTEDRSLLRAAQALSLVYSFDGDSLEGEAAELPLLAEIADMSVAEIYRHSTELIRRGLEQSRGRWRAILPHAIANRLASRALQDMPRATIDRVIVNGRSARLRQSFSRRLSFLHECSRAVDIVRSWLSPEGPLGNIAALESPGRDMLRNVAPVSPEACLDAFERIADSECLEPAETWRKHLGLIQSLAYDPALFERCALLIVRAATEQTDTGNQAASAFSSLFTIYLSGTHATASQRAEVLKQLIRSGEDNRTALGVTGIGQMLKSQHFTSSHQFEFGGRSRDYGYQPRSHADIVDWYSKALALLRQMALTEGLCRSELRETFAQTFRDLWVRDVLRDELEEILRAFAADGFWRAGWLACKKAVRQDAEEMGPATTKRLAEIEAHLRPSNLKEQVQAVVLGKWVSGLDLVDTCEIDDISNATQRLEENARELGELVATDTRILTELIPDLLRRGNRTWTFGTGIALASPDRRATWTSFVSALNHIPAANRDIRVLCGFLSKLRDLDTDLTEELLISASKDRGLAEMLPLLESSAGLDRRGARRLVEALRSGLTPVAPFMNLKLGRATDALPGSIIRNLILTIAEQQDGLEVALEILHYSDASDGREHPPELLETGRELLQRIEFERHDDWHIHATAEVAGYCLVGEDGVQAATSLAERLRHAVSEGLIYPPDYRSLLKAMLNHQPAAVLSALFPDEPDSSHNGARAFEHFHDDHTSPTDVIPCTALLTWCHESPDSRFPLAAQIVSFACRDAETGSPVWSEHAMSLIRYAPDQEAVIRVYAGRFVPSAWSGSRATIIESNAKLLDLLGESLSEAASRYVSMVRHQLATQARNERERETANDRRINERFE